MASATTSSIATRSLERAEHALGLIICLGLLVIHLDAIRWPVFAAFFVVIDVIGYLPGAIAQRRAGHRNVPRVFHYLYNSTHNWVTVAIATAAWSLLSGPEWALLAAPIHLLGDRALFGNGFKPSDQLFEPPGGTTA